MRGAGLVIGNIVRRVLHVVREEMQAESEEGMTEAVVATLPTPSDEKSSGLLSRALRQAVVSRAVSLHNLLDQGMFDGLDAAVQSPVEARQQPAAEGSEVGGMLECFWPVEGWTHCPFGSAFCLTAWHIIR